MLGFRAVAGSRTDRLRGWLRGDGFGPNRILGVVAPEASVPRFYSTSSAPWRNEVELCVRLVPGGCASPWLHGLRLGDRIEAFARGNPSFVPPPGRTPLILVGAGTGIAPLMGMIRANDKRRPLHLFWGGRSPSTDFLYEHELGTALTDGRLASLATAFSRAERRAWVQDRLRERPNELVEMIKRGGGVMVCGAAPMAAGVAAEFEAALAPHGLHVSTLKAQGRWAEDVF